jgi:pyrimidine operon attenuation protein/uracil phosphoribosyltransferase
MNKSLVLSKEDIHHKIARMSYEIMEANHEETVVLMAGIRERGYILAQKLKNYLETVAPFTVLLTDIRLNKEQPHARNIQYGVDTSVMENKAIVICDDVANSGRTLLYAMKPLLEVAPKKIQIAVLVDRKHKLFPVSPDFTGLLLSTSLKEHITADLGAETEAVYLV